MRERENGVKGVNSLWRERISRSILDDSSSEDVGHKRARAESRQSDGGSGDKGGGSRAQDAAQGMSRQGACNRPFPETADQDVGVAGVNDAQSRTLLDACAAYIVSTGKLSPRTATMLEPYLRNCGDDEGEKSLEEEEGNKFGWQDQVMKNGKEARGEEKGDREVLLGGLVVDGCNSQANVMVPFEGDEKSLRNSTLGRADNLTLLKGKKVRRVVT